MGFTSILIFVVIFIFIISLLRKGLKLFFKLILILALAFAAFLYFPQIHETVTIWRLPSTNLSELSIAGLQIGDKLTAAMLSDLGNQTQDPVKIAGNTKHFYPDFSVTLDSNDKIVQLIAFSRDAAETFLFTHPEIHMMSHINSIFGPNYGNITYNREQSTAAYLYVDKVHDLKFKAVYHTFDSTEIIFLVLESK
ncbi:MAG: hypothetical protein LBV67_12365 [Streptococcaceae bacterium]|nr:hypothetical protein [Streptococcaceae bacterium]